MRPRVPSAPIKRWWKWYPVLFFRKEHSPSKTVPSAKTTSSPSTLAWSEPYRRSRSPPAFVETFPYSKRENKSTRQSKNNILVIGDTTLSLSLPKTQVTSITFFLFSHHTLPRFDKCPSSQDLEGRDNPVSLNTCPAPVVWRLLRMSRHHWPHQKTQFYSFSTWIR